jgi:arylsulfatase A-like enzyme
MNCKKWRSGGLLLGAVMMGDVAPAQEKNRPNVLFIVVDDLNDWVGCLGNTQVKTPNIDRLAAEGTLFTKAYCAGPVCGPSRAAVMSGMAPYRTGVYNNFNLLEKSDAIAKIDTLSATFKKGGYRTAGASKVYHAWNDPQSWDAYLPRRQNPKEKPSVIHFGGDDQLSWGSLDIPFAECFDAQAASWVADEILQKHEKPFFAALGIIRPHVPWFVPKEYFDRFPLDSIQLPAVNPDDLNDLPEVGKAFVGNGNRHKGMEESGKWKEAVQGYLASIAFADDCVGKVLKALDRSPNRDNTIVVLWSDNGFHLGEKLWWSKATLWERSTHQLLIIRTPQGVPDQVCGRTVSLLDLFPTLVELTGIETPRQKLDGRSLVPLLQNPLREWNHPAITTQEKGNYAVRDERYRYIRYWDGGEELYDHEKDPNEWENLASNPELNGVKASLKALLPATAAEYAPWQQGEMPKYLKKQFRME